MSDGFGNRAIELAQQRAEQEAAAGVAAAAAALGGAGQKDCIDCDTEIPAERRQAMPNTKRCVDCAEAHERRMK